METFFDHLNEDTLGVIVEYLLSDFDSNSVINLKIVCPQIKSILEKDFTYLRIFQNKLDSTKFKVVKKHWTSKQKWGTKITFYILFSKFISRIHNILSIDDKAGSFDNPIDVKVLFVLKNAFLRTL